MNLKIHLLKFKIKNYFHTSLFYFIIINESNSFDIFVTYLKNILSFYCFKFFKISFAIVFYRTAILACYICILMNSICYTLLRKNFLHSIFTIITYLVIIIMFTSNFSNTLTIYLIN